MGRHTPSIGVLPPGFVVDYPALSGTEPIEMYVPFQMYEAYTSRSDRFVNVRRVTTSGPASNGVTREQASAELQTVAQGIEAEHPERIAAPARRSVFAWTSRRCMRR